MLFSLHFTELQKEPTKNYYNFPTHLTNAQSRVRKEVLMKEEASTLK